MTKYYHENKIVRFIALGPLIFLPIFILIIIFLLTSENRNNLDKTLLDLEESLILTKKAALKDRIDGIVDLVNYQNKIVEDNLTSRVKNRVTSAHKVALKIYEEFKDKKSDSEIKELIKKTLRPLLWNDGESFIWILDYNGVFQLAPDYLKHLEGSSIINFKDATGRLVIQEEIAIVKSKKEDFIWDTFTKPGDPSLKHYKQVAFVKAFGHFNWYFGSGEYLDTASKITNKQIINSIDKISKNKNEYIFIFDNDGLILLNEARPDLVGKSLYVDVENRTNIEDLLLTNEKIKEKFISYNWENPESKKIEKKYAYVKKVLNSSWVIGSGFYESDIKKLIKQQTLTLEKDYNMRVNNILTFGLIAIIISLFISSLITKYLNQLLFEYKRSIKKKTSELDKLNKTLEQKVKDRTLELEESKNTLEILATTDSLTGISNRYSIMNTLKQELERKNRYENELSILMYDIDFFKNINDTFGHDVGDEILILLTSLVKTQLRETDRIGRYGGEEFIVILPNTNKDDAKNISNRILQTVSEYEFNIVGNITVSIGLLQCEGKKLDSDKVFKELDNLLYESKRKGRNQVTSNI